MLEVELEAKSGDLYMVQSEGMPAVPVGILQAQPEHIVEPEAFSYWATPRTGARTFRSYLRADNIAEIAKILMRPVSLGELQLLVGCDGGMEQCAICEKPFQPVWWKDIKSSQFLERLSDGESVEQAVEEMGPELRTLGSFFLNGKEIGAFCGAPWFFLKEKEKFNFFPASHLVAAHLNHPKKYWGMSKQSAHSAFAEMQRRSRERREENQRDNQKAADWFGRRKK